MKQRIPGQDFACIKNEMEMMEMLSTCCTTAHQYCKQVLVKCRVAQVFSALYFLFSAIYSHAIFHALFSTLYFSRSFFCALFSALCFQLFLALPFPLDFRFVSHDISSSRSGFLLLLLSTPSHVNFL
jgi:hypothetical protein